MRYTNEAVATPDVSWGWDSFYDRVSQLVRALTSNPATSQQIGAEANRYDRVGNRLGRQVGEDVASATFNVVNQLQALTAGGEVVIHGQLDEPGTVTIGSKTVRTDRQNQFAMSVPVTTGTNQLTVVSTDVNTNSTTNTATFVVANFGSRTFTYDLNGNTTDDGQRAYEWDAENRLVKITYPGTNNYTQFTYDGLSRRVGIEEVEDGSTVSDQRFVWDGLSIAERRAADGTTVERRYYGQGFQEGGTESYYYVRDHLGSIRAVIDEEGEERGRWNYSLWGVRGANEITSDPMESDFGYTGHLEHERSGLVFALYRAYDPVLGRWLSRDPLEELSPDGPNPYTYVRNNPVNFVDPTGLWGIGWGDGNGNVSWNIGWGDPTLLFTPDSGMDVSMAAAATLDGIIPFADPFADMGAYDPCDSAFQFSQGAGAISRDVYTGRLLLGGLARFGGTRLGNQLLNSNRYLRIGPGRMPANGRFPASPKAPRISIGRGPGNPHIDLRP